MCTIYLPRAHQSHTSLSCRTTAGACIAVVRQPRYIIQQCRSGCGSEADSPSLLCTSCGSCRSRQQPATPLISLVPNMTDEAYSQVLDNWDQWLSPEAGSSPGPTLDPGAPRPFQSPSPYPCASPSVSHVEAEALRLLQPSDWDQEKGYSANPPVCVRYTIIWKVKFNNRMIAKDTEQDIVLAPAQYWSMFLQAKLNALLSQKIASGKRIKPDDSNVVVSVNERSERDLVRRFDEVNVDWSVVEKQLLSWGELLRAGRDIRVEISFNYVDTQAAASTKLVLHEAAPPRNGC